MNNRLHQQLDFSEHFYSDVCRLVAPHLSTNRFMKAHHASQLQDFNQATDVVLTMDNVHIAVRIRKPDCQYRDITLRGKNNGQKTERDKILDGYGDLYFYGWTQHRVGQIELCEWVLIDLDKVRETNLLNRPYEHRDNVDGRNPFITIPISVFVNNNALIAHETTSTYLQLRKAE